MWIFYSLIFLFSVAIKHTASIKCSLAQKCPSDVPCCSPYGECGTGSTCLNRCNPMFSFQPYSCLPQPILLYPNSIQFPRRVKHIRSNANNINSIIRKKFGHSNKLSILADNNFIHFEKFLITTDSLLAKKQLEQYDFIYSGYTVPSDLDKVISLRMPPRTKGSLVSTSKLFLYGRCSVTLKAAKGRGVITAIVLISQVGDEIDFEFLGTESRNVQSNYYHLGHLDYTKMQWLPITSDNTDAWHTYEIDWNKERIHWIIDGKIYRTVYRRETWDPIKKKYLYPQTPVRLEVALWPGGDINLPPGTAQWAGGFIDWDHDVELKKKGFFESKVANIIVSPYMNSHTSNIVKCIRYNTKRSRVKLADLQNVNFHYEPSINLDHTEIEKAVYWDCNKVFFLENQWSSKAKVSNY
ncbi:putative glycosylase PWA37_004289 [Arxiozyma heterogenica]|uniref:putative glycosylase n=1 Tax=Arxiozyma heterogenica TaxID=278026 RepID=UPI002EFE18B3